MGRKRKHQDPREPLPPGLYKEGRQYRARVASDQPWTYFGVDYAEAMRGYAAWRRDGVKLETVAWLLDLFASTVCNGYVKSGKLKPRTARDYSRDAKILKDAKISAIFTTEFKRTQETAAPTSASTGVRSTIVAGKDIAALIAKLDQLSGNALVVAHGNTIPDIVKSLGIDTPVQIPDDDYSELFIVTLGNKRQLLRLHYPQ